MPRGKQKPAERPWLITGGFFGTDESQEIGSGSGTGSGAQMKGAYELDESGYFSEQTWMTDSGSDEGLETGHVGQGMAAGQARKKEDDVKRTQTYANDLRAKLDIVLDELDAERVTSAQLRKKSGR